MPVYIAGILSNEYICSDLFVKIMGVTARKDGCRVPGYVRFLTGRVLKIGIFDMLNFGELNLRPGFFHHCAQAPGVAVGGIF